MGASPVLRMVISPLKALPQSSTTAKLASAESA
jgi:hypothetical protein